MFEMVFKLVFAVLGLLGNTLVIYAVRTFAFLQTKTYAFVTSLAVADLLLTLGNPVDQGEIIGCSSYLSTGIVAKNVYRTG